MLHKLITFLTYLACIHSIGYTATAYRCQVHGSTSLPAHPYVGSESPRARTTGWWAIRNVSKNRVDDISMFVCSAADCLHLPSLTHDMPMVCISLLRSSFPIICHVMRPVIRCTDQSLESLLGVNLSILPINMYVYVHRVKSAGLLVRAVRSYGWTTYYSVAHTDELRINVLDKTRSS